MTEDVEHKSRLAFEQRKLGERLPTRQPTGLSSHDANCTSASIKANYTDLNSLGPVSKVSKLRKWASSIIPYPTTMALPAISLVPICDEHDKDA